MPIHQPKPPLLVQIHSPMPQICSRPSSTFISTAYSLSVLLVTWFIHNLIRNVQKYNRIITCIVAFFLWTLSSFLLPMLPSCLVSFPASLIFLEAFLRPGALNFDFITTILLLIFYTYLR